MIVIEPGYDHGDNYRLFRPRIAVAQKWPRNVSQCMMHIEFRDVILIRGTFRNLFEQRSGEVCV